MTSVLSIPFVLEAPVDQPDGAGGVRREWQRLGTLWGQITPGAATATLSGETGVGQMRYRVRVRAAPAGAPSRPTPRQRLRLGSRVFAVEAVQEADATGRYLDCAVLEEISR